MRLIKQLLTACIAAAMCLTFYACSGNNTTRIHISGSTTIEPFMNKAVALFKQSNDTEISVAAPGSMAGIASLISGSCNIVMSSSPLLPDQKILARSKNIDIKSFLLGYDFIVPIVNKRNEVAGISLTQLRHIYSGKLTNWAEVGGKEAPIEIINRNMSSGSYAQWNRILSPSNNFQGLTLASNSAVLAHIAANKNAIGYISNSFVNAEIKTIPLHEANAEKDKNWTAAYPIKRPLFLYVDQNRFSKPLKQFIIFIILSDKVKKLFNESGFYSS
ncbi:MAG: PstS family phosphate ABC transporter substrate-binding protein [Desulfobacterales bacterium]|nr:PstS family phosphate ABC transporter substrate-binding protein [Desulfobacterales bacterium]